MLITRPPGSSGTHLHKQLLKTVFRIHDALIRIRGTLSQDDGSESCSFLQWLSRCQQKYVFLFFQSVFCSLPVLKGLQELLHTIPQTSVQDQYVLIRIRGTVSPDSGSWGSFLQWLSRCQQKKCSITFFLLITRPPGSSGTHLHTVP